MISLLYIYWAVKLEIVVVDRDIILTNRNTVERSVSRQGCLCPAMKLSSCRNWWSFTSCPDALQLTAASTILIS
jgi:hypothetical protein